MSQLTVDPSGMRSSAEDIEALNRQAEEQMDRLTNEVRANLMSSCPGSVVDCFADYYRAYINKALEDEINKIAELMGNTTFAANTFENAASNVQRTIGIG